MACKNLNFQKTNANLVIGSLTTFQFGVNYTNGLSLTWNFEDCTPQWFRVAGECITSSGTSQFVVNIQACNASAVCALLKQQNFACSIQSIKLIVGSSV